MQQFRRVRSGDVMLAVTCYGNAKNPPIILIHGYPDYQGVWLPVVTELESDFYVITYDVRGAGGSTAPLAYSDYSLEMLSQDLVSVIDAVSPERPVHLVGHDWGSIQSWESVTNPELGNRIASFTSISGPCLDHMGYWLRGKLKQPSISHLSALLLQMLKSWYVVLFHLPGSKLLWPLGLAGAWPWLFRLTEGLKRDKSQCEQRSQSRDGRYGMNLYRANFFRRLLSPRQRKTEVPVQLVMPSGDLFVSAALFSDLTQWVRQLYVRQLKAGHWLPLSQPKILSRYVTEFVMAIELKTLGAQLEKFNVMEKVLPLSGKLALVTGAASGIGRATALALAEQGASIVVADINAAGAERTAALARLSGVAAWAVNVDVGDPQIMASLALTTQEWGGIDILINNAGIGMAGGILQTEHDDWQRILNVNLWGVINGSRIFAKQMVARGEGGHIVNVASAAAFTPSKTFPAYATTKAACFMLSECMRAELADDGVGVSTVCPGFVDTGIATATHYVGREADVQEQLRKKANQLYKRRAFPAERVAKAIVLGIVRNKAVVLIGAESIAARWLQRISPMLSRRVARVDFSPN